MRLIHEACKRGVAAVVVTHDAQLASWADRVVFLRDGRVVDQTAPLPGPESLLTPGPDHEHGAAGTPRADGAAGNGGVPARRAVIRWAWRLFRREWRQQLLVLGLVTVAVAATIVGAAVATDTPPAANAGFGTAQDQATFQAPDPHLASQIAALQQYFGRVDVIENQAVAIPGSINTFDLRAQNPHGPYGQPMLSLVSGHYPAGPGQVAVTSGVAATFHLRIGDLWHARRHGPAGHRHRAEPAEPAGRVRARRPGPGHRADPGHRPVRRARGAAPAIPRAVRIDTALGVVGQRAQPGDDRAGPGHRRHAPDRPGGVGGFTVLAQRRLRSLGMLAALGATDRNIRLVVRANGVLVGVVGAVAGFVLGLAAWLAYRPSVESDAHHLIGAFQLPWTVIGVAMALAVIATYFAASRPGPVDHQDPDRDRPVRAARAAQADPPLGAARPDPARRRRGPVRLLRHEQRQRRRSARARPRLRRPDRGGDPAGPGVPHAAGQAGPAGPDRDPAGPARPGPLPGPLGLGPRRHHASAC